MTRERFVELVKQEQEGLRRFLLTLCGGNQADADDLAQEALLKAYLSYDGFVERFKFSTWLYRIAYNSFIDYQRKVKPEVVEVEAVAEELMEGDLTAEELMDNSGKRYRYEALYRAMDGLPPNEKTALLLFYMEDKSIMEIALIMLKPPGTIKSYLSRGRTHLKTLMSH